MRKALLIVALAAVAGVASAQNIATVNGKPIPKSREDAWLKFAESQGQKDSPQLRDMIKKELIRREVLLEEAAKQGIPDKPNVKFQLDLQRQNVIIQSLLREIAEKNPVTEAQIKAEYDKQKAAAGAKEYRARHILVENEADAKVVIDQLKKGAKFDELAKQKSKDPGSAQRGGDLDWAGPDGFVKPFSDAMVALQKGQYTQTPVQTQFGWHVIQLDDVRDSQFPPLDKVQAQLREMLQQQRVQAYVDNLEKKAVVK